MTSIYEQWTKDIQLVAMAESFAANMQAVGEHFITLPNETLTRLGWKEEEETWDDPYSLLGWIVSHYETEMAVYASLTVRNGVRCIRFSEW